MAAGGMPPARGSAKEIASLVAYLRSLASTGGAHREVVSAKGGASASQAPVSKVAATPTPVAAPNDTTKDTTKDTIPVASAAPPAASADQQGAAIFTAHGCAACHGVGGVGTNMAPALTSFSKTLTPAALTSLLQHPNHAMQAGGMPAVAISAAEMTALVFYLQHLGEPATPVAKEPANGASSAAQPKANASKPDSTPVAKAVAGGSARPMNQLELQGKGVFEAHSCGTCHGMDGVGGTWAAPALANTGKSFPAALLIGLLQHPSVRMLQGGMPVVSVSGRELDALAAYVSFISSKPAPAPAHRGKP